MSGTALAATVAERRPLPKPDSPKVPGRKSRPHSAPEFPGCRAVPMTLAEYDSHPEDDTKIEYFDSAAGIAWMVCDGPSFDHERPASKLAELAYRIAELRGSRVECGGSGQLRLVDAEGRRVRAMHPDQVVFLYPEEARQEESRYVTVGRDTYPDVVLEVDDTTDVRRAKLGHYEEWGFPEVWVDVPDRYGAPRTSGPPSGLRIYLLTGGKYALSATSRAFPGWRATEIHRALNERAMSAGTLRALERVAQALAERAGTGPDDDPILGRQRAAARTEGYARGQAEGVARGRTESRAATARAILGSRRVPVSPEFPSAEVRAALDAASEAAVVSAAFAASSEADFLTRLRGAEPTWN